MTDLTLLRPLWLLALPLLAVAAVWVVRRGGALGGWTRAVRPDRMAALRALGRVDGGRGLPLSLVPLAASGLIALALAGPAVERRGAATFRNMDAVILVLDASPSATEGAHWTDLQTIARYAAASLGSRPAALIVYAGDAYVASDLSSDHAQLGQTLSLVGAETVPDPGTRPGLALARARDVLTQARSLGGDVILLTDGGGLGQGTLGDAAAIADAGARLSVVMPAPDAVADTLARVGGGAVFATRDAEGLAAFLSDAARARIERQDWPLLFWADQGRLVLVLALVPVLLMFRRRAS
ncbi:hypothetical protein OCH239_03975 [Roseivivax halodurans JCM 10272]|uniref:VWFA domain-containing protein n=1 Tax=Roseivivax halodurans JCM 10272 TaxID=1449350 RepID=X7EG69_9RHOB|nr:VWA domain-containing protein [Roseivivax halodurans]ETX14236.1 hypothetical protein OCH239_03975 [Roseivivax halodurans JCM 10272]